MQRKHDLFEWEKRLREDEAKRKSEADSNSYVADYHGDHYTEWFNPASETLVVRWIAHPNLPRSILFDPTDENNQKLGHHDARSARDRAGRDSQKGDAISGSFVPAPYPKANAASGAASPAMAFPELLRFAFYARCYSLLGRVGIASGKGNKPKAETTLLRRFLSEYHAKGWSQAALAVATGRSKANVAVHIAAERVETPSSQPPPGHYSPEATESNLTWCDGSRCALYPDEGTEREYGGVKYIVSSTWIWNDKDPEGRGKMLTAPRCSHCSGLISKLSAAPLTSREPVASRVESPPPARAPLFCLPPSLTRSEILE